MGLSNATDGRAASIARFFYQYAGEAPDALTPLAGDASTRRYVRLHQASNRYIVMDDAAHPEAVGEFARFAAAFAARGAPVPRVFAQDSAQGLLLLEDFGDDWVYGALCDNATHTMPRLLGLLRRWQVQQADMCAQLPAYSTDMLAAELALFAQWFVPFAFSAPLQDAQQRQFDDECQRLARAIAAHDVVCVHRDFHCRNIMSLADGGFGILDFQGAVAGSVCYDLISLTRDCYIRYPQAQVRVWEADFQQHTATRMNATQWQMACTQTALQRHVKVLGIFVRLALRDGKRDYLRDLPRVLDYACEEAQALGAEYPLLAALLGRAREDLPAVP